MSEWIPVSQPPEKSGEYLVSMRYVTHDVVVIASYATDLHRVDKYDFPKHEAGWYNYDSEYGYYKIENVIVAYMPLPKPYVPDTNIGDIYECSCGYGWDKSKVVRHHFCPNCGRKMQEVEE